MPLSTGSRDEHTTHEKPQSIKELTGQNFSLLGGNASENVGDLKG